MKHQQPDIDNIYLYGKDPFESKYQFLINGREKTTKNPKSFIDYSRTTDHVYKNMEDYNPTKKKVVLIVFDGMIEDIESNKKLNHIVTELFQRGKKLNISLAFISQS